VGVAHHDVAHFAAAGEKNADLAAEPLRGLGEMPGELRRDDLPRIDPAAVRALQRGDVGCLDASGVAGDLRDG
jgi:hypothetical protein